MEFLPLYLLLDILRMDIDKLFNQDYLKELNQIFDNHNIYTYDYRYITAVTSSKVICIFIETSQGRVVLDKDEIQELKKNFVDINYFMEMDCFHFKK